ncbi:hypothetical protein BDM02DRAFT_3187989 [Thelephora ganbajun]|uniref:Uncharacterized protein n=1 Tax=Thelephora ganbajun TaxID=370292 RepID=A0ACB6ZD99_THEGA|nr:hypothetical protein BDM02DRAFT_3187989 [Thelephora ganbajun]
MTQPKTKITEHHQPPTPELSRIAWTASSRIDSARNETRPIYRLPFEVLALIMDFCRSEQFANYYPRAYGWVRLMLVSRVWKATILSFPSLWSKLVMSTSVSQSGIRTILERSGSHPLQVVIPSAGWSDVYPKSIRYRHIDLVVELLPRISQLVVATCGGYDTPRIYHAFKDRTAGQLLQFSFIASPRSERLLALHTPRLRSLYLSGVGSWPASVAENLTHIHLDFSLNPETLGSDLKNSPRLKQISINGVFQVPARFGNHSRISLMPGVRLVITGSQKAAASLFALGSTNYLSITKTIVVTDIPITPFLKFALPQDTSCFQNLNDLTKVHLKLSHLTKVYLKPTDSGEDPYTCMPRTATIVLRCSTAERETLHIDLEYVYNNMGSPNTMETEIVSERPPAMRALGYLRPLDLKKVVELRIEGFVGEWRLQSFELYHFLQHMPVLRRIVTGDDNREIFLFALSTVGRSASVIVEGV